MNVKQAEKIIREQETQLDNGKRFNTQTAFQEYFYVASKAFLECHELYKPLVDALEKINTICHGDCVVYSRVALEQYRKNILGE